MARVPRSRSRIATLSIGSRKVYNAGTLISSNSLTVTSNCTCQDSHGRPIVDGPFDSRQWSGSCPSISGSVVPSAFPLIEVKYDNYGVAGIGGGQTDTVLLTPPAGWLLDLVAGTNPSRPVVNIPEWVQNIAQFPRMIRDLGNLLSTPGKLANPKGAASSYLGEEFGWKPLIEDIQKTLDFQSYAIKRAKEINQLASGKGLRRRITFLTGTVSKDYSLVHSVFGVADATIKTSLIVRQRCWGTIHWTPSALPPWHPSDEDTNELAKRVVLGLTPEGLAKGLWAVIPWTWLIGWFTNLGKYTLAYSWSVPASHGAGCLMNEAVGTLSSGPVQISGGAGSLSQEGEATKTVKTRTVSSAVTPSANMPFLDMWRLSILGSLFVQRFFR